jgi:hypothetical protein
VKFFDEHHTSDTACLHKVEKSGMPACQKAITNSLAIYTPKSYGQQNVTLGHSMRWIFELLTPLDNDWGYELAKARS